MGACVHCPQFKEVYCLQSVNMGNKTRVPGLVGWCISYHLAEQELLYAKNAYNRSFQAKNKKKALKSRDRAKITFDPASFISNHKDSDIIISQNKFL